MRRHLSILAAAIAVGGLSAAPAVAEDNPQDRQTTGAQHQTVDSADRTADQPQREGRGPNPDFAHEGVGAGAAAPDLSEREANNIRGTLASATEAALTEGQLRSVVQRLTESDRERLMEHAEQDFPELDQLIARFNEQWRTRYDEGFDIGQRAEVFPPEQVRMVQGILPDAHLAGQRQAQQDQADISGADTSAARSPDSTTPESDGIAARGEVEVGTEQREDDPAGARLAGDRDAIRDAETDGAVRRDSRDEAARPAATDGEERARVDDNQVTVIYPESHGLPQVQVPLINEGTVLDAWRIDAPLTLDGQKLRSNVHKALNQAYEQREQWPQDVNEAYRLVSHHVMLALMDRIDEAEAQPAGQFGQERMQQGQHPAEQPAPQPQQRPQGQQPAGTGQGQTTY